MMSVHGVSNQAAAKFPCCTCGNVFGKEYPKVNSLAGTGTLHCHAYVFLNANLSDSSNIAP